jgi:hypothetical protein
MSSLIATIDRDRAWVDDGNKIICDGRTTACVPASLPEIPHPQKRIIQYAAASGSIDAIRKGPFTTFAGKNVIPLTWHSALARGCHSRVAFDLCG